MRARLALALCISLLALGCEEASVTTGSINQAVTPGMASLKPLQSEPQDKLPLETKRAWCEFRQRDIRAGKAPLGETNINRVASGDALCRMWFGPTLVVD